MAETLISPGVLARENDSSQITQGPREYGAAIIGPSVKGPVEKPTEVSSYSEYLAIFGGAVTSGSQQYSYLNQVAANNYFRQGGNSLLVTRVVSSSGNWAGAQSKDVHTLHGHQGLKETTTGQTDWTLIGSFNITGSGLGSVSGLTPSTAGAGSGAEFTIDLAKTASLEGVSIIVTNSGSDYEAGDTITFSSASLGASTDPDKGPGTDLTLRIQDSNLQAQTPFTLTTISKGDLMNSTGSEIGGGALDSGSADNLRWEITATNTSSGVFSLAIRRGDDKQNQKAILETFNNISLDPLAPNYIEAAIGNSYCGAPTTEGGDTYLPEYGNYVNKSRYVYVSHVQKKTPNYFDNNGTPKNEFTGSLPHLGSGSFGDGAGSLFPGASAAQFNENITAGDIQGISANDYTASIALMNNKDNYQFNLLSAPGLIHQVHPSQVNSLIAVAENRQDCLAVIDLRRYGSTVGQATAAASGFDTSYAATYWPWLQSLDADTGRQVWAPASTFIPGVYAFTDASSDPWFAPAGLTRGGLGQVLKAERKLTSGNRDSLYEANVNPIATFPQNGVVVFGQKTLQKKSSALDRVNVRRLLIALKSFISQVADNLVFEQNTIATRNNFLTSVNPYLEGVQQRQGLFAFKVVMDDSNNTPDVIDRNELIGQIYLQPTKTAEFIILDFNVLPTGATFPA
jgi:hypothetical protein